MSGGRGGICFFCQRSEFWQVGAWIWGHVVGFTDKHRCCCWFTPPPRFPYVGLQSESQALKPNPAHILLFASLLFLKEIRERPLFICSLEFSGWTLSTDGRCCLVSVVTCLLSANLVSVCGVGRGNYFFSPSANKPQSPEYPPLSLSR